MGVGCSALKRIPKSSQVMVPCLPLDDAFEVFLPVTTKTHATCISFIVEYMMCDVWLIP